MQFLPDLYPDFMKYELYAKKGVLQCSSEKYIVVCSNGRLSDIGKT